MKPDDWVYEAERSVHMKRYPVRITEPQEYFDYAVGTRWFRVRWSAKRIQKVVVKPSNHACAWSDFNKNMIYVPPWASNDYTLLHEVAHMCAYTVDHGPRFLAIQLALVERYMGREVASCYRHALQAYGIEIGPKVKPSQRPSPK